MKSILLALSLAAVGASTATAQVYQPNVVNGSILGGIAGAIIGGHNHDRWGEGALIGAAAGAILGSAIQPARPVVYQQNVVPVVQTVPTAQVVASAPVVVSAPAQQVVYVPAPQPAQVVYVQQPAQVVYAPYYASAPVYYSAPIVSVGVGYNYGPRRVIYVDRDRNHGRGRSDRHW
jgi:hypothetical protein